MWSILSAMAAAAGPKNAVLTGEKLRGQALFLIDRRTGRDIIVDYAKTKTD